MEEKQNCILDQAHRFELASGDLRDAAAAAEWLARTEDSMPSLAARVLEAGIAVVYARPFTDQGVGTIDKGKYAPAEPELRALHDRLIHLRNVLYAHTDRTSYRFIAEDVRDMFGAPLPEGWGIEPGSAVEMTVETIARPEWDAVARMAREQSERFAAAGAEARSHLPDASSRLAPKRITFRANAPSVRVDADDQGP